jgi:DNA-binding transcriptional MerR regulator
MTGPAGPRIAPIRNPVIDDAALSQIERSHASGLTSAEILDVFARHDVPLSEATLRKYVQLGLLPRSVRVGKKGKHQGSQGMYPASVVRQIVRIKQMMAESYTIEQIQKEFLFIRSDVEQLEQLLDGIFKKLEDVTRQRKREHSSQAVARDVGDARSLSKDLLARLVAIESRLTSRARMETVAAS